MLDACLKPYAAVAGAMAPIRAAIELATPAPIPLADIESVVIRLHANAAKKAA